MVLENIPLGGPQPTEDVLILETKKETTCNCEKTCSETCTCGGNCNSECGCKSKRNIGKCMLKISVALALGTAIYLLIKK
jgi:hypothetical protein